MVHLSDSERPPPWVPDWSSADGSYLSSSAPGTPKIIVFLSFMVLIILYGGFQKGLVLPLPEGVLTMMLFGG